MISNFRRTILCAAGRTWLFTLAGVFALTGCSTQPQAVTLPQYDPNGFADSLLQRFDKNSDAALSKQEGEAAPGLAAAWSRYDANDDGSISRDELVARAQKWLDRGDGMVAINCVVRMAGRQIGDVQVKLIPDESLEGVIQPAEALSSATDSSFLSIPPELKPEAHRNLTGLQYGLYRVEVSHPQMQIAPAPKSIGCDVGVADQAKPIVIEVQRK